jgi:hypothetical protein
MMRRKVIPISTNKKMAKPKRKKVSNKSNESKNNGSRLSKSNNTKKRRVSVNLRQKLHHKKRKF